ncbi:unnamed protein product [Rotaria socialis]|uniref:Uncharacterized protein n=1 Tax=Rotaria socialis TaxID=392032 RepID=A0A821DIA5_9BILA|nr:unnamed protein product [Rotaria socialis]CAF3536835.1 unnamed protein product [Rotaria socialis]CAF3637975.1 unnamed protein product [Rotaria socialis]CAF3729202.1 unnamed protein product [Rotaria socialis]CAF4376914.1 unnamed protein product [Rotaria socialis]
MSHHRSLVNHELNTSRDPRNRDRSRSDIRRPNSTDTFAASVPIIQPLKQEQPTPTNGVLEFFKTLGLNSQLIQALINANPQNSQPVQQQQPQQPSVNTAQDFASFLSHSYGLNSTVMPTPNQSVNRDPRRRQISMVTNPSNCNQMLSNTVSSNFDRPTDPRSNSVITNNSFSHVNNNSSLSVSIDELFKQYLSTIDQSLLSDEIRKKFQRIALLDNELDKLYRMNIELTKNIERRSRRRTSAKDKDPLLKENENLQNDLIIYIKTLKTTLMNHYPTYMFGSNTVIGRK